MNWINLPPSNNLNNLCTDAGLIDIWQQLNLKIRAYTFYSHPHNSYSRLDYFFIPKQLHAVQDCHIDPIALSDHASVHLHIDLSFSIPRTPIWRFNTSLLNNGSFCVFVQNNLSHFWLDNSTSPVSPAMMWDAVKDTLRGHLISNTSHQKKIPGNNRKNLEKEVVWLEQVHKHAPTVSDLKALVMARTDHNMDHTCHIHYALRNRSTMNLVISPAIYLLIN